MMLTSLPSGGPDSVPVTDPPGTLLISGAEGIEITVKAAEGTVIGVPYYWQSGVWQPLLGDATVAPRQVKAVAGGVDIGHLYFNKPATPLWFAVLETGGGTVGFCDIREAEGSTVLGQQDVTGSGGGGGGGAVTQGAGSGVPGGGWTVQLSTGSAFYNALTDAELRAAPVAISATSLPLPSGAATYAAQTDGSQRATVVGTASDNSANSAAKLPVVGARANAVAPTWTEGNQVPLSTDLAGNLRVSAVGTSTTTNASIGTTAAVAPTSATFVGGTDAIGHLRGIAVNADNDANPSSGKVVVLAGETSNTTPNWQNNKVVPLWIQTSTGLAMTSAAQGAAAATANAWPTKITDGTQTVTLLNTIPAGTEYAQPVRPDLVVASTSTITAASVSTLFSLVLAANLAAKFRSFYNPGAASIGLRLGSAGISGDPPSLLLAPGQTWVMPQSSDGRVVWTGSVFGQSTTPGSRTLVVTEIT